MISRHGFEYGSRHTFQLDSEGEPSIDKLSADALETAKRTADEMSKTARFAGVPYDKLLTDAIKVQFSKSKRLAEGWKNAPGTDRAPRS